ncbi:MAG: hypothetical protein U0031_19735 [Thermomicrobiales bacterium]
MNTVNFDGLARDLGTASSRRGFFRLLGGAAAVGAGLALTAHDEGLGKSRTKGKREAKAAARQQGDGEVTAQGRVDKLITICFQNQTRTIKKSKLGKFPGATKGMCPGGGGGGGTGTCTNFVLSGGPKQTDPISIDDDGSILHVTAGKFLVIDNNGMAGPLNPVVFSGQIGDTLRLRGQDWGGCRSFSPLWVHCLATGQSKQIFTGYAGSGCSYPKGEFLDMTVTISL